MLTFCSFASSCSSSILHNFAGWRKCASLASCFTTLHFFTHSFKLLNPQLIIPPISDVIGSWACPVLEMLCSKPLPIVTGREESGVVHMRGSVGCGGEERGGTTFIAFLSPTCLCYREWHYQAKCPSMGSIKYKVALVARTPHCVRENCRTFRLSWSSVRYWDKLSSIQNVRYWGCTELGFSDIGGLLHS